MALEVSFGGGEFTVKAGASRLHAKSTSDVLDQRRTSTVAFTELAMKQPA
jgi:hypothetical protein